MEYTRAQFDAEPLLLLVLPLLPVLVLLPCQGVCARLDPIG